jgi:hypothetical protein
MERLTAFSFALLLAGCAQTVQSPESIMAARMESCRAAGFMEDSDAFRLCLLVEQLNDRIDRLERRIDLYAIDRPLYRPWSPYWW